MNVNSWLKQAKEIVSPLDAELIVQDALQLEDRSQVVLNADYELDVFEQMQLNGMLEMRGLAGVPMAYVLCKKEFYGRDFMVDASVLIPRPETEQLIDLVKDLVNGWEVKKGERIKIVDVGTGSGCIAATLALEISKQKVEITGIDSMRVALIVARENLRRLGLSDVVKLKKSNLLKNYSEPIDIVVANLPYVDRNWEWRSPDIRFEPEEALYAPDGGLAVIKRLIVEMRQRADVKYAVLEADPSQHAAIVKFAAKNRFQLKTKSGFGLVLERARRAKKANLNQDKPLK